MSEGQPTHLLRVLRDRMGRWISPKELLREARIAHEALEEEIDRVRALEYKVIHDEKEGYKLEGLPEKLSAFELTRKSIRNVIGRTIHTFDEVASTNDTAWQLARQGAEDGTTIFAEFQTEGRGRLGRSWYSSRSSGLLLSVIIHPALQPENVSLLTIVSGVAIASAINSVTRLPALMRWPNDIIIRERKVAGILVEAQHLHNELATYVIGIGVNVNARADEFPEELENQCTSLNTEAKARFERTRVAIAIMDSLDRWYRKMLDGHIEEIGARWRELSTTMGRRIVLQQNSEEYRGRVVHICPMAGITVQLDHGGIRLFRGEHVTVVKT